MDTPEASAELSFDKATFATAEGGTPCSHCVGPLGEQYWQWQQRPVCATCRTRIEQTLVASQSRGAFLRAVLLGGLTALGCGIAYAAFVAVSDYQLALVTIGIAYLVAKVLRRCSAGVGGRRYQILAVVLTYIASAMGYAPGVFQRDSAVVSTVNTKMDADNRAAHASETAAEARGEPAKPVAEMHMGAFELLTMVVVAFAVVLALPVLSAGQAPLGLLIVGFGLWEAWKLTRGTSLVIEGPFRAVPAASPPSAA